MPKNDHVFHIDKKQLPKTVVTASKRQGFPADLCGTGASHIPSLSALSYYVRARRRGTTGAGLIFFWSTPGTIVE